MFSTRYRLLTMCANLVYGIVIEAPKKEDVIEICTLAGIDLGWEMYLKEWCEEEEVSIDKFTEEEVNVAFWDMLGNFCMNPPKFKYHILYALSNNEEIIFGIAAVWKYSHFDNESLQIVELPKEEEKLEFYNWCGEKFGNKYTPKFYIFSSY